MKLNQKSDPNPHTYGHLILVKKPEILNGKETVFKQIMLVKIDVCM